MSDAGNHEPYVELSPLTPDMHRALASLMEELEAIDWYNQRVEACQNAELKAILDHSREEEKEHAAMVLEWIRRTDPGFSERISAALFTETPIVSHRTARYRLPPPRHDGAHVWPSHGPRAAMCGRNDAFPEGCLMVRSPTPTVRPPTLPALLLLLLLLLAHKA